MRSIWVVLLDISSSMDMGFSGTGSPDPLSEAGAWRTKIEAAKDILIRHARSIRSQDLAIVTFSDTAKKVFHGPVVNFMTVESKVQSIEAYGNTNLAAAFDVVRWDKTLIKYSSLSLLLLTDGLSNEGDPVKAAQRLASAYPHLRIDTVLIDETAKGRAVAESVSIGGSVRTAWSATQLLGAVGDSRTASLQHDIAGLVQRRVVLEAEMRAVTGGPSTSLLTATAPLALTSETLRTEILPVLEALEQLQQVACAVSDRPFQGRVTSISVSSPVSISFGGFKEAIQQLLEEIIPWRKKHVRQMAKLEEKRKALENMQKRSELGRMELERRHLAIQVAGAELELLESKLDLSERLLANMEIGDIPRREIVEGYRDRLLLAIDRVAPSTAEFELYEPPLPDIDGDERLH